MAKRKYKINTKYQNSRPVNYNRWSDHKEPFAMVDEIMTDFTDGRKSGYHYNMLVLVLDLFESYMADPEQFLGCHRDNNHFKFKLTGKNSDRYITNPHISATYFVGVINHLVANKYVDYKRGGHFVDERGNVYGFLSRIRPTQKFIDICSRYKLTLDMIRQFSEEELIVLKSAKVKIKDPKSGKLIIDPKSNKPIGYDDTAETEQMREVVKAYNILIDATCIDIDIDCIADADRKEITDTMTDYEVENPVIVLRLANRNVYRVFNNADYTFRQGGRFYSAWWVGCPSVLRKYITIEGCKTAELDYSGIHIQLAYALEGINYAALNDDPYSFEPKDPDRELNKKILLTAINAKNDGLTASAVFDELREDRELWKYGIISHEPIHQILERLKEKHEPIRDYIASSKGIFLQYYDSLVMEQLISHFTNRGTPILTIHDSVVCKEEHQSEVREQMHKLFVGMINSQLKADVLEKSDEKKPLQLKYQRQVARNPDWQQSACTESKYKAPGISIPDEWSKNIESSQSSIEYTLRVDDLINIKPKDMRSNACTARCNTHKRYQNYIQTGKLYRGNIKIKLIKCADSPYIEVYNGH